MLGQPRHQLVGGLLLILFGLNAVDELDRTVFGILGPEIRDHFNLSNQGYLSLIALTLLGGLLIGLIEALWAGYVSSDYKDVAAFSILAIVLIFLPQGLLGKPEVEKV